MNSAAVEDVEEGFIALKRRSGFAVYHSSDPDRQYLVDGTYDRPTCTCREFNAEPAESDFQCEHIRCIVRRLPGSPELSNGNGCGRLEQVPLAGSEMAQQTPGLPAQLLIRRSISPDGRINSMSVEFSCPIEGIPRAEILQKVDRTLELQSAVVERFLKRQSRTPAVVAGNSTVRPRSNSNGYGNRANGSRNGHAAAAQDGMLQNIEEINTRIGKRLCLYIDCQGEDLKLIGSRRQLIDHIAAAGYPEEANRVRVGSALNLPCRVITRPSRNGKYIDVEEILPPDDERDYRSREY